MSDDNWNLDNPQDEEEEDLEKLGKKDKEEIAQLRKMFGLEPIVPGYVICLKCGRKFKSKDIKKNKICVPCSGISEY